MFKSLFGMWTKGAKMMVKQLYLTLFLTVTLVPMGITPPWYLVLYKPHFADLVTSYNSLSNLHMQSLKLPSTSVDYNHKTFKELGLTAPCMAQQKSHPVHTHGGLFLIIGVHM